MPRMVERVAKVKQEYAGRVVEVGETFSVEEQDVEILLRMGRIEPREGDATPGYLAKPIEASPQNRAMRAQTPRGRR